MIVGIPNMTFKHFLNDSRDPYDYNITFTNFYMILVVRIPNNYMTLKVYSVVEGHWKVWY